MTNLQIINLQNNNIPTKASKVPNFRGNKTSQLTQDTTEFSSKKKNNKNIAAALVLGGLGIAGAIYAFIKFHKTTKIKPTEELSAELKEIQQLYKDIFKRDINAKETKEFAKRYKSIIDLKTPDNDREYCEKLLDEICKDRKTKRPNIFRWISKQADADPRCRRGGGMATAPDGTYIDIYAYNYHNNPNQTPARGFFESLFHETHHIKQNEIIYRTDKEFFLQDLLNKFVDNGEGKMYKEILRKNGGNKEKALNESKELLLEQIDNYWGEFEPFAKGSAEYLEGLKLIEGKKNYKPFWECTNGEYKKQIIEKGAYEDGTKAEKLFDILKSLTI